MRLADIVLHLRRELPKYTDLFSDVVGLDSAYADVSGSAVINTAGAHGLQDGQAVSLSGFGIKTAIESVSLDGAFYTFTTAIDHDLTYGDIDYKNILLDGFTDTGWNGWHELQGVPNRRQFKLKSSMPLSLSGDENLIEFNRIDALQGDYAVSVQGENSFRINAGGVIAGEYIGSHGVISANPRMASVVNIDRAMAQYTAQDDNKFWLFVEDGGTIASKNRRNESDAILGKRDGQDLRALMIKNAMVYIVAPTTKEISAEKAVDICASDLQIAMLKSLNGLRIGSGLDGGDNYVMSMIGHRVSGYNKAYLIYGYEFETAYYVSSEDSYRGGLSRAFRDIDYVHKGGLQNIPDTSILPINLDDKPL